MILFRQKSFNDKKKIAEKIVGKKVMEFFDKYKNAIGITTGVGGLGLGGINLDINLKRRKNEEKFQKEQIDATKELTKAIQGIDDEDLKKTMKKNKKLFHKSQKPYIRSYYLPEPIENIKGSVEESLKTKKKK